MSVNKYKPHIWVIPEDDANRQLVLGFLLHDSANDRVVGVRSPVGGWKKVLNCFLAEYVPLLRSFPQGNVVLLIDFDDVENRRDLFAQSIPADLQSRVFVIGSRDEPETLKSQLAMNLEDIGHHLAEECQSGQFILWSHAQLAHNQVELERLIETSNQSCSANLRPGCGHGSHPLLARS